QGAAGHLVTHELVEAPPGEAGRVEDVAAAVDRANDPKRDAVLPGAREHAGQRAPDLPEAEEDDVDLVVPDESPAPDAVELEGPVDAPHRGGGVVGVHDDRDVQLRRPLGDGDDADPPGGEGIEDP